MHHLARNVENLGDALLIHVVSICGTMCKRAWRTLDSSENWMIPAITAVCEGYDTAKD